MLKIEINKYKTNTKRGSVAVGSGLDTNESEKPKGGSQEVEKSVTQRCKEWLPSQRESDNR